MDGTKTLPRPPFASGDEQDYLTGWRKVIKHRIGKRGPVAGTKRRYRRRERRILNRPPNEKSGEDA